VVITENHAEEPSAAPERLRLVRAIAFDCFGTLAEVSDEHFIDVMGTVALQHELDIPGKDLFERWLAMGKEVWRAWGRDPEHPTGGPEPRFGTYMELWTEQFRRTFLALEREGDAAGAYALMVARLRAAEPYPEVQEVLAALHPRYRLCLLSNADDEWLYPFVERAKLPFELVVSSESARSYKPRGAIFLGAKHAGLPAVWVNRYGATYPEKLPRPDLEVRDLRGLLPALLGERAD
jgi:FMN phosphatase YigB (HAD superfamily)